MTRFLFFFFRSLSCTSSRCVYTYPRNRKSHGDTFFFSTTQNPLKHRFAQSISTPVSECVSIIPSTQRAVRAVAVARTIPVRGRHCQLPFAHDARFARRYRMLSIVRSTNQSREIFPSDWSIRRFGQL